MTEEQRALMGKARESAEAARLLQTTGHPEIAISRAYYAMFYGAKTLLLGEGMEFSKHSTLISAFGQHFARTGRVPAHLHRYPLRAAELRGVGDYSTKPLSDDEAQEQIRRAEEFLAVVEQVLGAQQ